MDFEEIVQQSESLVQHLDDESIPHVHKNIEHIRQQKDKLSSRVTQKDIKAAKLLGNKIGYELSEKLCQKLETIDSHSAKPENIIDEDIPTFLKNQRENALLNAFTITQNKTIKDSFNKVNEAKHLWWIKEKEKLFNVILNSDRLPDILQLNTNLNSIEVGCHKEVITKVESDYGMSVREYVDGLMQSNLLSEMVILNPMKFGGDLKDIYDLVERYIQCNNKYSRVDTAIKYLQNEYKRYVGDVNVFVKNILMKELADNNFEDGYIDGAAIWPMLYVNIRCGHVENVLKILKECSGSIGTEFCSLLEFYLTNGSITDINNQFVIRKITNEYKRTVRCCTDLCKRLVYCLILHCDPDDNHTGVLSSIDDYLWYKLQCSYAISSEDHVVFVVDEFNEQHFEADQNPLNYCRILLLTQRYEASIAFLSRYRHLLCHAVHLGVVLWSRDILTVSNRSNDALINSNQQINLIKLVELYSDHLINCNISFSLDLFYLLRQLNLEDDEDNAFIILTSKLIINASCGDIVNFIERLQLNRFVSLNDSRNILNKIAQSFYRQGLLENASDVYKLSGNFVKAAELMDQLLTQDLTNDRLLVKASPLQQYYSNLDCTLCLAEFIQQQQRDPISSLSLLDSSDLLARYSNQPSKLGLLLKYVMSALRASYEQLRYQHQQQRFSNSNPSDFIMMQQQLKQRAAYLVIFVSQTNIRMPAELYTSLSQLERDLE